MIERAETVLGWWLLGCIEPDDVRRWADARILEVDSPREWLISLSISGPDAVLGEDGPRLVPLDFVTAFHAMVEVSDPDDVASVERFMTWAARAAMGEDLDAEEVKIGYEIEHLLAYDEGRDPRVVAREALEKFKPLCRRISTELPWTGRMNRRSPGR